MLELFAKSIFLSGSFVAFSFTVQALEGVCLYSHM